MNTNMRKRLAMLLVASTATPIVTPVYAEATKANPLEFESEEVRIIYPPRQEDFVFTPNGLTVGTNFKENKVGLVINGRLEADEIVSIKGAWTTSHDNLPIDDPILKDMVYTESKAPFKFELPIPTVKDVYWYHTQITVINGKTIHYSSPMFNFTDVEVASSLKVMYNNREISKVQVKPGSVTPLDVVILPDSTTNKKYTATSSDPNVATFENGKLVAHSNGVVTITYTSVINPALSKDLHVTVNNNIHESLTVTPNPIKVGVSKDKQINASSVMTDGTVSKDITYKIEDTTKATITPDGIITGMSKGATTLTVYSKENDLLEMSVPVSVTDKFVLPDIELPAKPNRPTELPGKDKDDNIIIDNDGNLLDKDGNTVIDKDNNIIDGNGNTVIDKDNNILDGYGNIVIDKDGNILDKDGNIIIDKDGNITDKGNVEVDGSITDNNGNTIIDKDGNILDGNGNIVVDKDGNIKYPNGDTVVDNTGNVLDKDGNIIIDKDGNMPNLIIEVKGIQLNVKDLELAVGDNFQLEVITNPTGAYIKDLTWTSVNPNIVTVDNTGLVTGVKKGSTLVTVVTHNGKKATLNVKVVDKVTVPPTPIDPPVNPPITPPTDGGIDNSGKVDIDLKDIAFSTSDIILNVGETKTMPDIITNPTNATVDKSKVTYTTTDTNLIQISNNQVIGLQEGVATVTAELDGKTTTLTVVIRNIPTGFYITNQNIFIEEGNTEDINYTIAPASMANTKVIWKSLDESIATVDSNGKVYGIRKGNTEIIGETVIGGLTAKVNVDVTAKDVQATGFDIIQSNIKMPAGVTAKLGWRFTPADTTNKNVTFSSSDDTIASVTNNGLIQATTSGAIIITGLTDNGLSDTVQVDVVDPANWNPDDDAIAYIEYIDDDILLFKGEKKPINYRLNSNDVWSSPTWDTNDSDIAEVDDTGIVQGISEGQTSVTVKIHDIDLSNGASHPIIESHVGVIVLSRTQGVSFLKDRDIINVNETVKAEYVITPADATNKDVQFDIINGQGIVHVDPNGVVTGLKPGVATIRVTTIDGGYTDTMEIVVTPGSGINFETSPEKILVGSSDMVIDLGNTEQISYVVKPENATDKSVTFIPTDNSIIQVSPTGEVTGIKEGTTTIKLSALNDTVWTLINVTVVDNTNSGGSNPDQITDIEIVGGGKVDIAVGEDKKIDVNIKPDHLNTSENKDKLIWQSKDPSIAVVDKDGNITGIGEGTVDIIVTTPDGKVSETITVTVSKDKKVPVESLISLSGDTIYMNTGESMYLDIKVNPTDATIKDIKFEIANSELALVTNQGKVLAYKEGRTYITVTSVDNPNVSIIIDMIIEDRGNTNNNSNKPSSESSYNKKVDKAVQLIKEQMPFTLLVGEFDLSAYFGLEKSLFENHILDVKQGVQNVKIKVGNKTVDLNIEGIVLNESDKTYKDLPAKHWAFEKVSRATQMGVLNGKTEDMYVPKEGLTHADATMAINRVLLYHQKYKLNTHRTVIEKYLNNYKFNEDHWAHYSYASIMAQLEDTVAHSFIDDGGNVLKTNIKRKELAEILYAITKDFNVPDVAVPYYKDIPTETMPHTINYVTRIGLMQGDNKGKFNPEDTLTRAELAQVVVRLHDTINLTYMK